MSELLSTALVTGGSRGIVVLWPVLWQMLVIRYF